MKLLTLCVLGTLVLASCNQATLSGMPVSYRFRKIP